MDIITRPTTITFQFYLTSYFWSYSSLGQDSKSEKWTIGFVEAWLFIGQISFKALKYYNH